VQANWPSATQEVITCRPADLISDELDKLRAEAEGLAKADEDVLTYAMFPDLGRTFLQERAAGTLTPEPLLPPEAKEAAACPTMYAPKRIQGHPAWRDLPHPHQGHRPGDNERPFYVHVDGVAEEVLLEALDEVEVGRQVGRARQAARRPAATPPANGRVRAMPAMSPQRCPALSSMSRSSPATRSRPGTAS
jgi:pyruvate carboxylase subunit B